MSVQSSKAQSRLLPSSHPRPRSHNAFGTVRPAVLAAARLVALPLASAAPLGLWERKPLHILEHGDNTPKSPDDPNLYLYLGIAIALVLLGGVFAGLTIALMGQDETYLQVIASSGDGSEKRHADKVLKLLNKGKHWVLVTLLLSNVITNETLPIVLDRSLGGGWPAVVSSTVLIVIFGEIVPQSICVRYGLSIGAFCAPLVHTLMWIMCIVAWPTAKLLDWLLGEDHGTMYKKAGLKTLVTLHKTLGTGAGERLMEDEVTIINSVLDLKEKPVGNIMTPMQDVFTMSADTILDERMMDTILSQGYSRIPIYAPENPRNFIGMLLVKILITYDPEDCKRVRDFALATLPETTPHTSCLDIINFFQEGKSHMVLVSEFPGQDKGALGVVTLEDVIEELIGEEIIDESDVFIDVHKAIRRMTPAPRTRFSGKHFESDYIVESEDERREASETRPLLQQSNSGPDQRKSSQTTFLMRRKSSAASENARETKAAVPIRGSASGMKEHLRHLGPSNAAAHPRQTKFSNVKIKPGVGTIREHDTTTKGAEQDAKTAEKSTGEQSAAYGTMGPVTPTQHPWRSSNPPGSNPQMTAHEASEQARENAPPALALTADASQQGQTILTPDVTPFKLPEKLVVGEAREADTLGELASSFKTGRSQKRVSARSGSITETTMDVNGLKKTVLEMTSSSEEGDEGSSTGSAEPQSGRSSFFGFGRRKSADSGNSEQNAGAVGGEETDLPNSNSNAASSASNKKRRKKRGKKKKSSE